MGGAGEVVSPQETEADYESDFELDKVDSSGFSIKEGVKELDPVGSTVRYEMMKLCTWSV